MTKQYHFQDNDLVLKVNKASVFMRFILFTIAILGVLLPLGGLVATLAIAGSTLSIIQIMLFFALLFVSLFVFRLGLWNTYGEEEFFFGQDSIQYQPNYGWFKDKRKNYAIGSDLVSCSYQIIGYENENKGVLVLSIGNKKVGSAVKMPAQQLDEICKVLTEKYSS